MPPFKPFLRVLATLGPSEFLDFGKFLSIPLAGSSRQTQLLFAHLQALGRAWREALHENRNRLETFAQEQPEAFTKLQPQTLDAALFPGKPFNSDRIRRIVSQTKKAVERYIRFLAVDQERFRYRGEALMLYHFLHRGDETCLQHYADEFRKAADKKGITENPEYWYLQHRIEDALSDGFMRKSNAPATNFQRSMDALDRYYLMTKVQYFATLLGLKPLLPDRELQLELAPEIATYLQANNFLDSALMELYFIAYRMMAHEATPADANQAIQLLQKHQHQIAEYDFRQIVGFVLNYADVIRKEHPEDYPAMQFALIQQLEASGVLYIGDKLVIPWFNRVIFISLFADEIQWMEDFLFRCEDKLEGAEAGPLWMLNMLRVTLDKAKGDASDLEKVRSGTHRDNMRFQNPIFGVWRRILHLKALFELALCENQGAELGGMAQELELHLDAFRNWLHGQARIPAESIVYYESFRAAAARLAGAAFWGKALPEDFEAVFDAGYKMSLLEKRWLKAMYAAYLQSKT